MIGALSCALLQDYYINGFDLITLGEGNAVFLHTHTHGCVGGVGSEPCCHPKSLTPTTSERQLFQVLIYVSDLGDGDGADRADSCGFAGVLFKNDVLSLPLWSRRSRINRQIQFLL